MRATTLHSFVRVGSPTPGWLRFADGVIVASGSGAAPAAVRDGDLVDARGRLLSAGFVDMHVHGGGGFSADDGPDGIRGTLDLHRRHGSTSSVISLVTSPLSTLERQLREVAELSTRDSHLLGSHLEGPFLSPLHKGAHDEALLRTPSPGAVDALLDAADGTLRLVTLAPELPGALDAIDRFVAAGVVVAVGHTAADYDGARAAFDRGASVLTHAFNGMPGLGRRAPGPVLAALRSPGATLEVIADGHHVHPAMIELLFASAPGRVALVSDAMAAAGAGDGQFRIGSQAVTVAGGRARLSDGDSLAGSTLTLADALRIAVIDCGVDPAAALDAVTRVPATALGVSRGRLRVGDPADLVLLDEDFRVTAAWSAGDILAAP